MTVAERPRVLLTGATGFLGRRLVPALVARGYPVRCLARESSGIDPLRGMGAEIYIADVTDKGVLAPAFDGIGCVIHAAADTSGKRDAGEEVTVRGTRNVLELCREHGVRKLVYMSSCNVYDTAGCADGEVLTEESPLERHPELRGAYTWAKFKAEESVRGAMAQGLNAVCLRPGTYFGPGGPLFTPMMGVAFGNVHFIIGRDPRFRLPLVCIDNLVEAIVASIESDLSAGKIYNVVDSGAVNKKEYIDLLLRKLRPKSTFVQVPFQVFYRLAAVLEMFAALIGKQPVLTRYRVLSSQRPVVYSSEKIKSELNWAPLCGVKDAIEMVLQSEQARR